MPGTIRLHLHFITPTSYAALRRHTVQPYTVTQCSPTSKSVLRASVSRAKVVTILVGDMPKEIYHRHNDLSCTRRKRISITLLHTFRDRRSSLTYLGEQDTELQTWRPNRREMEDESHVMMVLSARKKRTHRWVFQLFNHP
jgi:hypothetical protein